MKHWIRNLPEPFTLRNLAIAGAVAVTLFAIESLIIYHTCGFSGCPDVVQVGRYVPEEASVVLDRNGEELGRLHRVNRVITELEELPDHLLEAVIAVEDQEFYEHGGVDWTRVLGALWANVTSGEIQEGFSTISMQVARTLFPDQLPRNKRTLSRKLKEVKVAHALEGRYPKDTILSLYLNLIYFGSGAWGIDAAAWEYFGKRASELDLEESTLLAGLPRAPSSLNPRHDMDGALDRRETVLRLMQEQGYITEREADRVRDSRPELADPGRARSGRAPYFVEHVRQILQARIGDAIYTGGYTVHTTLEFHTQQVAEHELKQQLEAIEAGEYGSYPRPGYQAVEGGYVPGRSTPYLQGAVIVMDAGLGDILALVGGRDFAHSQFDRARHARRQPGSAFKPFVYAAALQSGYTPVTQLRDTPYYDNRGGRDWRPRNFDGSYAGRLTMRQALVRSSNAASIRLAEGVGLARVARLAERLGLNEHIPRYPSIAIGSVETTLLDLVAAYGAFAALGEKPRPRFITRVEDREGYIVWHVSPRSKAVLDPAVAFLTVDLLRDVVDRGTGAAVRSVGFRGPAAGKTGTTNGSADVWFVGFTPKVVTGVWIGLDKPQRIMPRATGGRLAAPLWGRVMRQVSRGETAWSSPPGVMERLVDARGRVLTPRCRLAGQTRREYFLRGTAPFGDCMHRVGEDRLAGGLALEDTRRGWRGRGSRLVQNDGPAGRPERARPDTVLLGTASPRRAPTGAPQDTTPR